ncbi:MAG: hypothetical protein ABIP94_14685, partial [Planctomycetota bacterium]
STAVDVERQPTSMSGRAQSGSENGGELSWCGARFHLPPGAALRLDSVQGQAFVEPPPAVKQPPAVKPTSAVKPTPPAKPTPPVKTP